ncbi:MAG: hypothetical protein RIC14_05325 [Filomicrobium sp.]
MNVKELREAIGEIQDICEAAGAAKAAADLDELTQIFDGHEDQSVSEFLAHLRSLYAPVDAGQASSKTNDADVSVVEGYVARLKEVGTDRQAFERIFQVLTTDPQVRKAEANAIQHSYIGGREAWPTKKAALKAIEKWFFGSRYQDAVLEDIKKVTPW